MTFGRFHTATVAYGCGAFSIPFHCHLLGLEAPVARKAQDILYSHSLSVGVFWDTALCTNFRLVPPKYRILFSSIVTVVWNELVSSELRWKLRTKESCDQTVEREYKAMQM